MTHPPTTTELPAPHRYGCGDAHADAVRLGVWLPAGWGPPLAGWGPPFISLAVEPDRLSLLDCCTPETRQALLYISLLRRPRRTHRRRLAMVESGERGATSPPPDGLRTPAEAARKLRCSIKTLDGYVKAGALKYVALGHGKRRQRRMFTDADLNEFIANQTRKDSPCPRSRTRVRLIGDTTSRSEVVAFSARRNARTSGTRKK